jgi:transcriptional regulator with XRE-family HTH domain
MDQAGLSSESLGKRAGLSANTIRSFLSGSRWPVAAGRRKIETALEWPAGLIEEIALGHASAPEPTSVAAPAEPANLPAPIEVVVGRTRMLVYPDPDYTAEQVQAMAPAILAAALKGIAEAVSPDVVTPPAVGHTSDS